MIPNIVEFLEDGLQLTGILFIVETYLILKIEYVPDFLLGVLILVFIINRSIEILYYVLTSGKKTILLLMLIKITESATGNG